MSIRLRLTLWYSGLLAAMLLLFGVSLYLYVNWDTYNGLKQQVKNQSDKLRVDISQIVDLNARTMERSLNLDRRSQLEDKDLLVQLINYENGVISQSSNLYQQGLLIPYPDAAAKPVDGFYSRHIQIGNAKYEVVTYQRIIAPNGELLGLLQVGALTYDEDRFLAGLRTALLFYSIIVVLIAYTVGMLIARQALRPIDRVIESTRQIEKGADLSVRIPAVDSPKGEIGTLVNTLNGMLGRLEKAYNELDDAYKMQRRFVSDASHELRTPLTTIRGNIDLLEKMWSRAKETGKDGVSGLKLNAEHWNMSSEAMSDISAEAKRMSTLVGDLLALARADAGYVMEKVPLSLLPLTGEVVRRAGLLPRTAEWKIGDLAELEEVRVYGNHDYLQQLLFIFIENAFKYTPEGYVELSAIRRDGHIGWVIRDTGIGMNPDEIPHIFDRFYRADESRGVTVGTGLGLSIAKWILDEHGGSVEVTTRENEGSTFIVWLPIDFSGRADSSIMEETDLMQE